MCSHKRPALPPYAQSDGQIPASYLLSHFLAFPLQTPTNKVLIVSFLSPITRNELINRLHKMDVLLDSKIYFDHVPSCCGPELIPSLDYPLSKLRNTTLATEVNDDNAASSASAMDFNSEGVKDGDEGTPWKMEQTKTPPMVKSKPPVGNVVPGTVL